MLSVTQRIKQIKQPRGGFLKPKDFYVITNEDNIILNEENIHSSLVGLTVDYMTRFMVGTSSQDAFKISLQGAHLIKQDEIAINLLKNIKSDDDSSIISACKLVGYDVCARAGSVGFKAIEEINPNQNTIYNIRVMINRSIEFIKSYGPITKDGFTFEGGYTSIVCYGDGDFLTKDTLWDFKVSFYNPTSAHTLQLLMYYIMGKHSIYSEFNTITKIGIFNPRKNTVYLKDISSISEDTIHEVEKNVIGYSKSKNLKNNKNDIKPFDDLLPLTEIMRILSCSRYMIMKYYSKYNLPLIKINNKYYIERLYLIIWVNKMEKERERKKKITFITTIILSILIIIFMFYMLSL